MTKLFTFIIITSLSFSTLCYADVPRYMPTLSKQKISNSFLQTKNGFEKRWSKFVKHKKFTPYTPNFDSEELSEQFATIKKTRATVYYEQPGQRPQHASPDFERSQVLLTNGYFKSLHHIAFEYNYSHPSYNSSNVILNGHKFLALEGPQKPAHVNNFLRLLINYDVKHIVRLTTDIENGVFKTENYWENSVKVNSKEQQILSFNLSEEDDPQPYSILYYGTNIWQDYSGVSPEFLLNIVNSVRKNYNPGDILAIHCSAGVGRTGTFIAAFLLLDSIDKQLQAGVPKNKLKISIEELVYKLSMQRAYMVSEPGQYLSLHQLVKTYLTEV